MKCELTIMWIYTRNLEKTSKNMFKHCFVTVNFESLFHWRKSLHFSAETDFDPHLQTIKQHSHSIRCNVIQSHSSRSRISIRIIKYYFYPTLFDRLELEAIILILHHFNSTRATVKRERNRERGKRHETRILKVTGCEREDCLIKVRQRIEQSRLEWMRTHSHVHFNTVCWEVGLNRRLISPATRLSDYHYNQGNNRQRNVQVNNALTLYRTNTFYTWKAILSNDMLKAIDKIYVQGQLGFRTVHELQDVFEEFFTKSSNKLAIDPRKVLPRWE